MSNARYNLFPSKPSFHLRLGTSQAPTGTGSYLNIEYGEVEHNIGGHYSTSNDRFVCPLDGRYLFIYTTRIDNHSGSYIRSGLKINGSVSHVNGFFITQDSGSYTSLNGSQIINLSANDYVQVYFRTQSDSSVVVQSESSFSGMLME